jgi:hypothetical protein
MDKDKKQKSSLGNDKYLQNTEKGRVVRSGCAGHNLVDQLIAINKKVRYPKPRNVKQRGSTS